MRADLRSLAGMAAVEWLPLKYKLRVAPAFRGEAPLNNGLGWCVAYRVSRALRDAVFVVAR